MNRRHCARWFAYPLQSDLAEARLSRHSRYRNSNLLGAMAFWHQAPGQLSRTSGLHVFSWLAA
jgi:hypothetical protein